METVDSPNVLYYRPDQPWENAIEREETNALKCERRTRGLEVGVCAYEELDRFFVSKV